MSRRIDTQAVIDWIRAKVQGSDPAAPAATYDYLYTKASGLFLENSSGSVAGPLGMSFEPGGRLTLTTATPVTTADVTAAATLYYTPYKHNMISLYDGARWIPVTFTEKSLSLVGYTASKPYDIWGYLSSGTLALESTVWTNATTRATALAYQDGRYVKSGTATRLYLGTIYINASGGQTDDSAAKRFVWNYYNRVSKYAAIFDGTSHSYETGTWRSWNNDTAVRAEMIFGVIEDFAFGYAWAEIESALAGGGWDVTNASTISYRRNDNTGLTTALGGNAFYPTIGYHFIQATEFGFAGATQSSITVSVTYFG